MQDDYCLDFTNECRLKLALRGDTFLGIADVEHDGVPLRDPALPWAIYTECDDEAVRFGTFRLKHMDMGRQGSTLTLESPADWLPRAQAADKMGDSRIHTRRAVSAVATIRWHIRPIREVIFGREWVGLTWWFEYECPGYPIQWLLEDATWELGGRAEGCTLIRQDVSALRYEQSISIDEGFASVEHFDASGRQQSPMDMLARGGGSCICDFQACDDRAMALFTEPPAFVRSRVQKFAGEDVIHHTDHTFFPLADKVCLPKRKLLVHRQAQPLKRHEWRNLWLDCFTDIRRRYHVAYGYRLQRPQPVIHAMLWNDQLELYGSRWHEPLAEAMNEYGRLGYRVVFTHGVWQGTSDDPACTDGRSICANYDFVFSESFGGDKAMRELCTRARENEVDVVQWAAFHFHSHAAIWRDHPDWLLREAGGDPWDAAYSWPGGALWAGRMRSGFRDHLLRRLVQSRDATGLAGYFWDSYGNLGHTCIDWSAPDRAPQGEDIWRFQADLQELGLSHFCEMSTIFGVSMVGSLCFDAQPGDPRCTWSDIVDADMAFAMVDTSPQYYGIAAADPNDSPFRADRITPDRYFWLAAHRCLPIVYARPWGAVVDGRPVADESTYSPGLEYAEAMGRVNRLYNRAEPFMHRLRLVEDGTHVLWLDEHDEPAVVWAFEAGEIPADGSAFDLPGGRAISCDDGVLALAAGGVYLLNLAAEAYSRGGTVLTSK